MENIQNEESSKKESSILSKLLKVLIPFVLGVLVLWFLYKDTDFDAMWATIKNANVSILLLALVFGPLGNLMRGIRWKLLIEPLGYNPSKRNLIYAVWGSYAVNFAIPRGGEVWRCAVIAKGEKIPFTKLLGTLILDRLSDTVMVLLIILLACCFNFEFFMSYIKEEQSVSTSLQNLISSPWLIAGVVGIILAFVVVFTVFKHTKLVTKLKEFFKSIGRDIKTIFAMKKKGLFILYSVAIWGSYFLYFYINFYAFGFTKDLGLTAGLIAFALSSLSMAIPTNGGIGVWHAAIVLSLGIYGITKESGEAFAFAVFGLQSLWTVLIGLFGIVALAVTTRNK